MLTFCLLHSVIILPRFRVCFLGDHCNVQIGRLCAEILIYCFRLIKCYFAVMKFDIFVRIHFICSFYFLLFIMYLQLVGKQILYDCFFSVFCISLFRIFAILLPRSHNYPWCLVQSEDEVCREGTEPRSRAHKKGGHFWKKNRPQIAQNESRGNRWRRVRTRPR